MRCVCQFYICISVFLSMLPLLSCQEDLYKLASQKMPPVFDSDDETIDDPNNENQDDTTDITPPEDIDLKANRAGNGAVSLIWDEPGDNDYAYLVITWNPDGSNGIFVRKGIKEYEVSELTNNRQYTFKARTVDYSGNVSDGDVLSLKIPSTVVNVISISDDDSLQDIANDPSGFYILTEDIKLVDTWTPIGNYSDHFSGTIEGNGCTITDLTINNSTVNFQGFLGYVDGGSVQNLIIKNARVSGVQQVGILAGYLYSGTITNCAVSGEVTGTNNYIGGFSGNNYGGTINSCSADVSVTGNNQMTGGFIGYNNAGAIITDCYSTGDVYGANGITGGFVGYNAGGEISNCYSTGAVTGSGTAGFAGANNATIADCFYDEETSGQSDTGNGEPKSTAEMQEIATFSNTTSADLITSWDFVGNPNNDIGNEDIWSIDPDINNGYPYHTWMEQEL